MERRSCNDRLKPPPTTGQFSAAVDKRIQHYRPAVVLTTGHRSALRRVDERVVEIGTRFARAAKISYPANRPASAHGWRRSHLGAVPKTGCT
jgi:hypothetical protein